MMPTAIPPLGPQPVRAECPSCHSHITTHVEEESSKSAYICCVLLFLIGCFPCSCIPFCMDTFKSFKHECPSCRAYIGTYNSN